MKKASAVPTGVTLLRDFLGKSTQTELATLIGVSPVMAHYLVTGQRRPGLRTALAIERATGGAVPAESWVHQPSVGARNDKRNPPRRVRNGRAV